MENKGETTLTKRYRQVKFRVHTILDEPPHGNRTALAIQIMIAGAIVFNTIAIVLYTVPAISTRYRHLLDPFINLCLLVFTAEYLLRLWACTSATSTRRMINDRVRYALHLYQIIDLISITPVFFPVLFPRHLVLLRTFRIVSIFKLGRYSRYSRSLDQLKRVLFRKREIFGLILFFLVFVVLFSATLLYLVENPVQPDKFSSIPAAMWWAVMTVTTVGYGDIYPVTPLGKGIASLFTILGVLVLALPSAILASGFIEERNRIPFSDAERSEAREGLIRYFENLHNQGSLPDQEYEQYMTMIDRLNSDS